VTPAMLSWVLSLMSALMLWLMGNGSRWGPKIGLINQVLWAIYAIWLGQFGLLPGVIIFAVIHLRNLRRMPTALRGEEERWLNRVIRSAPAAGACSPSSSRS